MSTLLEPKVVSLLDELFANAAKADAPIVDRLRALAPDERTALFADYQKLYGAAKEAYLAVSREVGTHLYVLARARRARHIVEFGTSFGISTIFLAAALRDNGGGTLVTTEMEPSKALLARAHLERAGLADLVEIREGDALRTLVDVSDGVSLVYLDGAKTLYRDVLRLLEPRLSDAAVIVADNVDMQDLAFAYTSYVRAVDNGYLSSRIVIEEGLEVSLWLNASVSARTAVAL